jgi:hypothetical protein
MVPDSYYADDDSARRLGNAEKVYEQTQSSSRLGV